MQVFLSEQALLEGCRQENRAAQQKLYEHYSSLMLGICRRYLADPQEAEEVMIEGFYKVFRKVSQFREEGSFEGWIRRIMINECLNRLRKNRHKFQEVSVDNLSETDEQATTDSDIDAEILLAMVEQLPTGYRTVFNLYAIEGYSHKEIAEKLKISESTSKSQLSRARGLLQTSVKQYFKKTNRLLHG